MRRTLVFNIGELVTPRGQRALGGAAQAELVRLRGAYVLMEEGRVAAIGEGDPPVVDGELVDAEGRLVTPGLVDAHTHLVFGGWRQQELKLKLQGCSYLDILAAGGGIHSTVRATRAATEDELVVKALDILGDMLAMGVTTCEAKSGYGLNPEEELKQLRVVRRLKGLQPVSLVSTFMGAHTVPEEYKEDRKAYIDLLVRTMIPQVAREGLAEYCDVFMETGVFTAEETRTVLLAAVEAGLGVKVHADEMEHTGGAELAGALGAQSAEHLIAASDEGIRALSEGGVIACLLPATSLYLGRPFARARDMIASGVPVALGSDFNPGSCPCTSLQFVMNLATLKYRMTPEEVLSAATLNAAAAVGRAGTAGTLEPGKAADLVIWNAPDLEYLVYRLAGNLVDRVIKGGQMVVCRQRLPFVKT